MGNPVVIIGAGPTGLMMAAELARYGVRTRIVEQATEPSTTSKALGVQARTLEMFERHGMAEKAVAQGLRVRGIRIHSEGREVAHIRLQDMPTRYPYVLVLPQPKTEALLRDRLEELGIGIEWGAQATGLRVSDEAVEITLKKPGTTNEERCRAPYVVGCDGAHSTVRHAVGIPFSGYPLEESLALADVRVDWDGPSDEVSVFLCGGDAVALFPMPGGVTRIVIENHDGRVDGEPNLATFQDAANRCGLHGAIFSSPIWISRFHISQRQVSAYRSGRVFLAGDASHIHSPLGGQGMNTGIQDVCNLAWKMALVLEGHGRESLLDTYDEERRPLGAKLLKATGLFSKIAFSDNRIVEAVRDRVLKIAARFEAVQEEIRESTSELGIRYRKSSIVREAHGGSGPEAGDRSPIVFSSDKHLLLCFGPEIPFNPKKEYFEVRRVEEPAIREAFHADEDLLCLIRPDGYIGFRGKSAQAESFRQYLSTIFTEGVAG